MKLAEFKRTLKPGDYLTLLSHSTMPTNSVIGKRRRVTRTNTVEIMIESANSRGEPCESHLEWPKAAGFERTDGGFNYTTKQGAVLVYKWEISGQENAA